MKLQSSIALCAVVAVMCGLTLCRPPTPRVAGVEAPAYAMVTNTGTTLKEISAAINQAEGAVQVTNLDGPLTLYLKRHQ